MREQIFLQDDVLITDVIAAAADIQFVPAVFHETDPAPFEMEFHDPRQMGTRVNYVENKQIGVQYLDIDGPRRPSSSGLLGDRARRRTCSRI